MNRVLYFFLFLSIFTFIVFVALEYSNENEDSTTLIWFGGMCVFFMICAVMIWVISSRSKFRKIKKRPAPVDAAVLHLPYQIYKTTYKPKKIEIK